jgi:hypothetical protein
MQIGIGGTPHMKVRRQKFGIGSLLFMLIFGFAFAGIGIFAIKSSKIDPGWTRISGHVTGSSSNISNGSTTYTPIVSYEVNGRDYQVTASTSSNNHPAIGTGKEVAYNPASPDEAKVVADGASKSLLYLFPAAGILCILLAPFLFFRSLKRSKNIGSLMQSGLKVQGIITDIQQPSAQNNSSNSSYKIVVQAPDNSGSVQTYVSDSVSGIGGLAMADFRANPIPIDVYIDPANPKNYYVDVSEVPNLTPERIGELIKSALGRQNQPAAAQAAPVTPVDSTLAPPPVPPVPPGIPPAQ